MGAATDSLFPIGNSSITFTGVCAFSKSCTERKIGVSEGCNEWGDVYVETACVDLKCRFDFTLTDWFVDAADLDDSEEGNQEFPGGVGYEFELSSGFDEEMSKCEVRPPYVK